MTATKGHLRFIGGTVYCPRMERRYNLGADHKYGREFVCPGCGVRIPARSQFNPDEPRDDIE